MTTAIITGASSGLGKALFEQDWMNMAYNYVVDWSRPNVDVTDRSSVRFAMMELPEPVDVLINCAGVNHIDWFGNLEDDDWDRVVGTNAKAIFQVTQELLNPIPDDIEDLGLRRGGTIVNIVSNASHVPMTHSAVYNASKGAAHILTLQMARELKKTHDITVFGVSPNKLKGTGMSAEIERRVCELRGWTPEQAAEYQLAALPAGEETDPERCAELIAFLLSNKSRHKYLNGCILPYGA